MYKIACTVAVIGGGPAGLAAAEAAKKEGAEKVMIIERDQTLGGILQQCIHPGFGLNYFKKELTGPEYAGRFAEAAESAGIEYLMNTMVLEVLTDENAVVCVNSEHGITKVSYESIILAMGCRERTRANIAIPGTRPAGVYTAGAAQRLVNRQNAVVGKKVVILGSGDIGMIMARRMTLEGAEVVAVVELMDYLAGLTRNRVQCLDDFGIPLKLAHTITNIHGNERVEGVTVAKVDENKQPVQKTAEYIECDTVLLSVGLLPENELTKKAEIEIDPVTNGPVINQYMQTSVDSVFACGNVVHVNDLVDNVTAESISAGSCAAKYAMGTLQQPVREMKAVTGTNVRYLCPQKVEVTGKDEKIRLYFRVLAPERDVVLTARAAGKEVAKKRAQKVSPGEMEYVEFRMSELAGDEITVSVSLQNQTESK